MSEIPFEILLLSFEQLNCNDLSQCQLVCRSWNQASLQRLYSDIKLDSEKKCLLYVRTIKDSPHLGNYLEIIKADIVEEGEEEEEEDYDEYEEEEKKLCNLWDRYDLLNTVMNHCPNVLKILNDNPAPSFLARLINAGLQDRLSRLQYVPNPGRGDFYHYANTALVFKKTLTMLELPNDTSQNLFGAEAYLLLCENLYQFPCLQTLKINCYSKECLSYYDKLINNCKDLTNLIIHPKYYYQVLIPINSTKIFRPHPKMETLECTWPIVNAKQQIAYIMQKFPNLTSLIINHDQYDRTSVMRFSLSTLLKLLRYIISLKKGVISVILNPEDCVNPYVSIINEKINTIDISISISYSPINSGPHKVSTCFTGKTLTLDFSSYTDHHIKLLTQIGRKVRSLTLEIHMSSSSEEAPNINHSIELIKLCPSLQHLELVHPGKSYFTSTTDYQNFELKSLTLDIIYSESIKFLEKISLIFPNLKNLHLFTPYSHNHLPFMTINMPNASFDSLTCSLKDNFLFEEGSAKVYIRLKTKAGLRFYLATKNQLRQINGGGRKRFHLNINCRSLTKLKID